MNTLKQQKQYAVIQLGYGCFGIGATTTKAKTEAKNWTDSESHSEIDGLDLQYSVRSNFDGDLVLLECSENFANLVNQNGGDISYGIIDGVVY
jgi:hypothetical protein